MDPAYALPLFWLCLLSAGYSYVGYPILLSLLPFRRSSQTTTNSPSLPKFTIIVAAHNEESRIESKIQNTLAIDYPRDQIEFIVASDASTDRTVAIAESYSSQNVRVVACSDRGGKESVQARALSEASGDFVVFTDAATTVAPDCLHRFVEKFRDPQVGAVSSEDLVKRADGRLAAEGLYVRYEMWLRRLEGRVHSIIGLTGALFAVRRELCSPWFTHSSSDFRLALETIKHGMVCIPAPEIKSQYEDVTSEVREFDRKFRTVVRGLTCVASQKTVLNPFRYPLAAFQLWSHKVARWGVPWFLLALLPLTFALVSEHEFYLAMFALQALFYGAAAVSFAIPPLRKLLPFRVAMYFCLANTAILVATVAFACGRRVSAWSPTVRPSVLSAAGDE